MGYVNHDKVKFKSNIFKSFNKPCFLNFFIILFFYNFFFHIHKNVQKPIISNMVMNVTKISQKM